jgi:hypothetical protein
MNGVIYIDIDVYAASAALFPGSPVSIPCLLGVEVVLRSDGAPDIHAQLIELTDGMATVRVRRNETLTP